MQRQFIKEGKSGNALGTVIAKTPDEQSKMKADKRQKRRKKRFA